MAIKEEGKRSIKVLIAEIAVIAISYAIGVYLRLRPALQHGVHLTADDPLLHYRLTESLVEGGGLLNYDLLSWHPWGFDPTWYLPTFHYYTGAALYKIAHLFFSGLSVYEFSSLIPAFFSPLAVIPVYFLAKELWGRGGAAFAAFSIGTIPAYWARSYAGFYRHEQFAIPIICLSLLMTVKSMRSREIWKSAVYACLSGISLIYVAGLWAAYRLLYVGYALFLLLLILLNRAEPRSELALALPPIYTILASLTLLPRNLLLNIETMPVYAAIVATLVYELAPRIRFLRRISDKVGRNFFSLGVTALFGIFVLASGKAIPLSGRLARVLNPGTTLEKGSVVHTVMEHAGGAGVVVGVFTTQISFLLVPFFFSAVFLIIEKWRDITSMLLLYFSLLSIYFSISMVRLPPLAAPFLCVASSYIFERVYGILRSGLRKFHSRKRYLEKKKRKIGTSQLVRSALPGMTLLTVLCIAPLAASAYQVYSMQVTGPPRYLENVDYWMGALEWLRDNSSEEDVILSWWDYGYWINYGANRKSLADGLTFNATQIREIASAFIGSEEEALDLAMRFDVSYVVIDMVSDSSSVLDTGAYFSGPGKWTAMAWIAKKFEYSPYTEGNQWGTNDLPNFFTYSYEYERAFPTDYAMDLTLFKLSGVPFNMTQPKYFELVYTGMLVEQYPAIVVFKVKA